jgi:hypothetical protein
LLVSLLRWVEREDEARQDGRRCKMLADAVLSMRSAEPADPPTTPDWGVGKGRSAERTYATTSRLLGHVLATSGNDRELTIPVVVVARGGFSSAEVGRLGGEVVGGRPRTTTVSPGQGAPPGRIALSVCLTVGALRRLLAAPWVEHAMFENARASTATEPNGAIDTGSPADRDSCPDCGERVAAIWTRKDVAHPLRADTQGNTCPGCKATLRRAAGAEWHVERAPAAAAVA